MAAPRKVAVIGAGTMGRRISYGFAIKQIDAQLFDVDSKATERAVEAVHRLIAERTDAGLLPPGTLEQAKPHLTVAESLEQCVRGSDFVIETVPEKVELKRQVFGQVEPHLDADAILASNTSSIPGSELSSALKRPERFFNLNYANPNILRVEVMGHPATAPAALEQGKSFLRAAGLVPLQVRKEIGGYAMNRIWRAIKKEVLHLVDQGYLSAEEVDRGWMLEYGLPIGPCGRMDRIGLDVILDIEMNYFRASGDPSDRPPKFLQDMVADGKLGQKSGQGFYSYPHPAFEQPGWLGLESD